MEICTFYEHTISQKCRNKLFLNCFCCTFNYLVFMQQRWDGQYAGGCSTSWMTKRNQNCLDLRSRVLGRLCQAFQFQLLPDGQKVVQAVLLHLHLPVVDKVHHWYQIWPLKRDDMKIQKTIRTESSQTFSPLRSNGWGWSLAKRSRKNVLDADRITWKETSVIRFDEIICLIHVTNISLVLHLMCSYLLTILASKSHIRELSCSSNLRWTGLFWSIRSRCILRTYSIVGQPLCRSDYHGIKKYFSS